MGDPVASGYHIEHNFGDEVWVTVPTQVSGRELALKTGTIPSDILDKKVPYGFEPIHPVINFQVDDSSGEVMYFVPPMILRVKVPDEWQVSPKAGLQLKLAYWNGTKWTVFTKRKHQFHLGPEYAIAVIRQWGDPTVAWGQ